MDKTKSNSTSIGARDVSATALQHSRAGALIVRLSLTSPTSTGREATHEAADLGKGRSDRLGIAARARSAWRGGRSVARPGRPGECRNADRRRRGGTPGHIGQRRGLYGGRQGRKRTRASRSGQSAAVAALAGWAAASNCWLVHYSTDYVFDGRKTSPYVETDEAAPQNTYGRSKRAGENAILASGCRHLIFRTSWVHAPRGSNFIRTILRLAGEQNELRVVADQCGAPTGADLVADVTATAIAAAARQEDPLASGIYHLAAAGRTTWHEFARFIVSEAIERGAMLRTAEDAIVPIASTEYHTAASRPANSLLDTGKLRAALGIELPNWKIGARRSIAGLFETRMA